MMLVLLIVTFTVHGGGVREIKFPMPSMLACEEIKSTSLGAIAGHFGQVQTAECVVVERGA